MCLGKPLFSALRKKIEATKEGYYSSTEIRYLNIADCRLKSYLQDHIYEIVRTNKGNSINGDLSGITTLAIATKNSTTTRTIILYQAPLSLKYEEEISVALSLNLPVYPCPPQSDTKNLS